MDTKRICPSCQKPLPPDVPLGLCPECLIKAGFNTGTEPGSPASCFVPPPVEQIARLFPQLEVFELVGKGGMGAVYKARQSALDRFVALKILRPSTANDAGFAERFNREARALARLNHPNIVAVHDFGRVDGLHYLIMEFVDGANLREVERAGRLLPEQALTIVPQICEALQFAHGEGIVHRDIKPENILMDKRGRVKITDFGIAKILGVPAGKSALTGAKDVVGTPHYMAPEQIEKPTTVDHRADIYSLGVVFYEMLTGELPLGKFAAPSAKVQVDVRLDEVVLHALEKEPERRYQHASVLKTDVETIAGTPASPQSTPDSLAVGQRRHGLQMKSAGFFFAAVCFLIAGMSFGSIGSGIGALFSGIAMFGFAMVGYRYLCAAEALDTTSRPPASATEIESVRRRVKGPAIGLLVTGVLNWFLIPAAIVLFGWGFPRTGIYSWMAVSQPLLVTIALTSLLLCGFIIFAALKMMQLESRGAALAASVLAVLVSPGNIVGLPIGIWSLVVLNRGDVRDAFARNKARPDSSKGILIPTLILLGVLTIFWPMVLGEKLGLQVTATMLCAFAAAVAFARLMRKEEPAADKGLSAADIWWKRIAWTLAILMGLVVLFIAVPNFVPRRTPNVTAIVAHTIRDEVGRQLRESGASYNDLHVTVAEERDSGTPFTVSYKGLRNFKYTHGGQPDPQWPANANGQFIMNYVGGGEWQGKLGDKQFTVQAGRRDNIDLPFVNDPEILGEWESVDSVAEPSEFNPDKPKFPDAGRNFRGLTFLENGKVLPQWWKWTKGVVIHTGDQTASRYEIREIKGQNYLFMEWKSGDVMFAGMKPQYSVLRKKSAALSASAEAWSPTLPPGEKPDPQKIRDEANDLMNRGRYEESLQRHIWLHNHGLEYDGSGAVRLSFWLSNWVELGRRYPKAKQALVEIRDAKTREFTGGGGYSDLFQDVASINGYLQADDETYALFKSIHQRDPALAEQCYFYAESLLVKKGEYELCFRYMGDPQRRFEMIRNGWQMEKRMYQQQADMRVKYPSPSGLPSPPDLAGEADNRFAGRTCQLIEILVGSGHKFDAEKIRNLAVAFLDHPQLKSAVSDAERKIGRQGETGITSSSFGPVTETVLKSQEVTRDHQTAQLLDLDTGAWATNMAFGSNDRETHAWVRSNRVDLLGVVERGQIAVLCFDMAVVPLASNSWDTVSSSEIKTNWNLNQQEPKPITGVSPVTDNADSWIFQTREGARGVFQILGKSDEPPGVKIRYRLVQQTGGNSPSLKPKATTDQVIVEDLALRMLAAIRDKEDDVLQSLAVDRIKGWRDALPTFAFEGRERFQQMKGRPFNMMPTESLTEGDYAVVKCDDPKGTNQIYLVLFFVKADDGWKNWMLRNSPPSKSLTTFLKERPGTAGDPKR